MAPVAAEPLTTAQPAAHHRLVETLARISRNGGTVQYAPPPKPYGFRGGLHLSISQEIQLNLWRFKLTSTARDVLDHMTVTHDEDGIVKATQTELAQHFGHSQAKISRGMSQLCRHHFVWKLRRGYYQLNPVYAYRFGSRKHALLLARLGEATLKARDIVIPLPETRS